MYVTGREVNSSRYIFASNQKGWRNYGYTDQGWSDR